MEIFDRWGLKMFETTNPEEDWDGSTLLGTKATDGTYYYVLKAKFQSGQLYDKAGFVTLVR